MKKIAGLISLLLLVLYSCTPKEEVREVRPVNFESLNIDFTNGWAEGFIFRLDSVGIYFSRPFSLETAYYGLLPDSIFDEVNENILKILNDSTVKSSREGTCADCPALLLEFISDGKTHSIRQEGQYIDSLVWSVVEPLWEFSDSGKHQQLNLFWEGPSLFSPFPPLLNAGE
jgi:hypothetical protein